MRVIAIVLALRVVRIVLGPPFVAAEHLAAPWARQPEESVGLGISLVIFARRIRERSVVEHERQSTQRRSV